MARIVKKLSDPYHFIAINGQETNLVVGNYSTNNANVVINGNLTVSGKQTTIETNITVISDNIITLNSKSTATPRYAGIEVDRFYGTPSQPTVQLVWDESIDRWTLTNDGTLYTQISSQFAGNIEYFNSVVDDPSPQLGGNLDVNNFTITSLANVSIILSPGVGGNTEIDSVLQLKEVAPLTANISGYGLLAAGNVKGGGTGLYVTHSASIDQELITKKKAIVYSLIF